MNVGTRLSLFVICALFLGMQGSNGLGWSDGNPFTFPAQLLAAEAPPSAVAQSGIETVAYVDVAAVLARNCNRCHSGGKPPDGLRTDSYAGLMAGGWNGPVVVPGNPAKSELARRIRGTSTPRMPYKGPPWLTEADTVLIEQWIRTGATGEDTKKP